MSGLMYVVLVAVCAIGLWIGGYKVGQLTERGKSREQR